MTGLVAAIAIASVPNATLADGRLATASQDPAPPLKLRQRTDDDKDPNPVFGNRCPLGTFLSPFDMPIYDDEEGLFVVGYETVWFCLPEDLEPAG
ncbi:MAG: hypothetical protein ACREX9_03070 [Gammaproteobacteria bacterium]